MEIDGGALAVTRDEIFIDAPIERVWAVHTDVDSWPEWRSDVSRAGLEGPLAVGSVFRWRSGGLDVVSRLREVEPGRRICWTGEALGTRAVHTWALEPREGGVLVRTGESMEGWLVRLMRGRMQRLLQASVRVWLEDLKRRAEGVA